MRNIGFPNCFSLKLKDAEYKLFADLIYARSGIYMGDNKKEMLRSRLMKRMRLHHFESFEEYYDYVVNDQSGDELVAMLDVISTNVTSFFREKRHFDFLNQKAFPEMLDRKTRGHQKRIRIWSAGCSTGEEAYSILISLLEFMRALSNLVLWDIKVLGTDISTKVLAIAEAARYDYQRVKTVPPDLLNFYFNKKVVNHQPCFEIKEYLRDMTCFHRANLVSDTFPFKGPFDIIFCRNTMIYFDKETQIKLIHKLCSYLDPYGYFFIGHSETLLGIQANLKNVAPAVFKKM